MNYNNYGRSMYGQSQCKCGQPSPRTAPCMHNKLNNYSSCKSDCKPDNAPVDKMNVGMGYAPWQPWQDIYDYDTAFETGTIFKDLDKPFWGGCK